MMHKAWCGIEEVPYNFSGSSIKFWGHTGWKNRCFESNLSKITRPVAAIKSLRFALLEVLVTDLSKITMNHSNTGAHFTKERASLYTNHSVRKSGSFSKSLLASFGVSQSYPLNLSIKSSPLSSGARLLHAIELVRGNYYSFAPKTQNSHAIISI